MNAPKKKVLEDGTVIIEKPDGLLVRVLPNGDVVLTNRDGSSVTTQADGFIIQRDAAGREIARTRSKSRTPPEEREFNVATMNVDPLARKMSNLAPRPFVLDGVHFASVEGFYRWLQWSLDAAKQQEMPPLTGADARAAGRGCPHTEAVFRGQRVLLGSPEHHAIIKEAIRESLRQNPDLAKEFAKTHPRPIVHNTGRPESLTTKYPGAVFARTLIELREEMVNDPEFRILPTMSL